MNTRSTLAMWWHTGCNKLPGARVAIPFLLSCLMEVAGTAQTYSVLHSFDKSAGWGPQGTLLVSGGTLFGTAAYDYGSVFKLDLNGLGFGVLKVWSSSEQADSRPCSGLVLSGSTLYGTTAGYLGSYYGTMFKVETNGTGYAVLKHFTGSDGSQPREGLVLSGSTLYGTTSRGGSADYGTVFRINTDGNGFSVLKQFSGTDGSWPNAPLVLSGTILYGTTVGGGGSGKGTVFRINTDGTGFGILKQFSGPDGDSPHAGLALAGETLYGTTYQGGTYNLGLLDRGTVFRLNTDGTGFTVLKQFTGLDGCYPLAGVLVSGSRVYGTTSAGALGYVGAISGNGVLFEINTNGTGFVVLKQFTSNDGFNSEGGLAFSGNALYGTTVSGGTYSAGTVFRLALPDAPQVTAPPLEQVAVVGSTATFTVDDLGQYPLAYQWLFQGTNLISGATDSALQLTNVQFSQVGPYSVVITNSFGAVTSSPALLRVIAASTLTNCAEADLRALVAQGGAVTVNCDGTIALSSTLSITKDLLLDATGHHLILSGSNAVRVIYVNTNVSFTAMGLTVANGLDPLGAGIYNDGGTLNLLNVCCRDHFGTNLEANFYATGVLCGAAIFNHSGTLNATNSSFTGNALRSGGQRTARGGAIFNDRGRLNLHNCLFLSNSVVAGAWTGYVAQTNGLEGSGGAIYNEGTLSARACAFVQNSASGGTGVASQAGLNGGAARGGAICDVGSMVIERSLFANNTIVGGTGGAGANGGYAASPSPPPGPAGTGATGGDAFGGALFIGGPSSLVNCTLAGNLTRGGPGGVGGTGGAWMNMGTGQEIDYAGGAGGCGGAACGAAYDAAGALRLTNCTIAFNSSIGGDGGSGGLSFRGGPPQGSTGCKGMTAGALQTTNGVSLNCILASNSPTNGTGKIADGGHNLSSDASCAFTNTGSVNNIDPKLSPLADNGGLTLTMALLPGSLAIDAGDPAAAPPTDQRGVPRPFGLAADVGAFEFWPTLQVSLSGLNGLDIMASGISGQTCRLLASGNASSWTPIATNQFGSGGTVLFHDTRAPGSACRFYRLVMP